ncbi:hypothetical protein SAMN05192571_11228 [Pleomorphomonas diazotrophica]|nr:hypothetical protein SAMN05192571_11228 [Pleomorphomonas diazotrophica]
MVAFKAPETAGIGEERGRKRVTYKVLSWQKHKRRRRFEPRRLPGQKHDLGQICRSTSIFLISAMAFAGLSPLGQVWAQFMMVWQR